MRIARVEVRRYVYPLDPPPRVAWDPTPRAQQEATIGIASSAELLSAEDRVARVVALRDAGVRAVKIRFHHNDWREDVETVEAVRDAVGPELELMVDANQGWRMPGDRAPRWDVATAAQCA